MTLATQPYSSCRTSLREVVLSSAFGLAFVLPWALAVALAVVHTSAHAAEPSRVTRTLSEPFETVRLAGGLDLQLQQGDGDSLVLEGDERLIGHILTSVHDGVLEIRYEGLHVQLYSATAPRVILTARALKRVRAEGSGTISCDAWHAPQALALDVAGSSDIRFHGLSVPKLSVHIAGSSEVELVGAVAEQEVRINGAGDYEAGHLKSGKTNVVVAGAGDVTVWATETLSVSIAGAGDVKYYGRPSLSRSVAGMGDIEALGESP